MRVCGLDLSLRSAGLCVLGEGELRTLAIGRKVDRSNKALDIDREEMERMIHIQNEIVRFCKGVDQVFIERYAFGKFSKSASVSALAELGGIVKYGLFLKNRLVPHSYSPLSARKKALGFGYRAKVEVENFLIEKGLRFSTHDEADAFVIAAAGYCDKMKMSATDFWDMRVWEKDSGQRN